jgi:hypothetical protein
MYNSNINPSIQTLEMKLEEIISTSRNVLSNTYSLYTRSDTNSYRARCEMTKCLKLLTELKSTMKNLIKYLLRDFQDHQIVLRNRADRELLYKTKNLDSIRNIVLTRRAKFIWKESSILRRKLKQNMIRNNISISIKYKE